MYCRERPSIVTCSASNRAWTPKTLPVRRWQARQWQIETRTGSPSTVSRSCSQLHAACRVLTSGIVDGVGSGDIAECWPALGAYFVVGGRPEPSADPLRQLDDDPLRAADVAEPIDVFVALHLANERPAVGSQASDGGVDVVDYECEMAEARGVRRRVPVAVRARRGVKTSPARAG